MWDSYNLLAINDPNVTLKTTPNLESFCLNLPLAGAVPCALMLVLSAWRDWLDIYLTNILTSKRSFCSSQNKRLIEWILRSGFESNEIRT